MVHHFKISTLRISFMCLQSGEMPPYLGSTVRGIMGHCFREAACTVPHTKCFACHRREECLYVHYFSNTGKIGGALNPYAIMVLQNGKTKWQKGDECEFDLSLFGNVVEDADIYVETIRAMENKGWGVSRIPFKLSRISDVNTGKLIYASGNTWKKNLTYYTFDVLWRDAGTVLVVFDTPLRIVSGKNLCRIPSFQTLIQFIMRRFTLLSQIYTDGMPPWDEKVILDLASHVTIVDAHMREVDFQRYSINQKEHKLELPAVEGWILYEGNLRQLTPILEIGRHLHVGKGSTIGFGHYDTFYDT